MKIAFCTDGLFPYAVGGMQRHSRLLIEALAVYRDVKIHVFHPHDEKVFTNYDNVQETTIQDIDTRKNYLKECKAYSKRIHAHLIKEQYDIIYSQGLCVWYRASDFSDSLIVNPHGLEPYQAFGTKDKLVAIPFKWVFNKIFKSSKRVVSLGGGLSDILKSIVPKEKILVLPNATLVGDEKEKTFPDKEDAMRLMFVARFAHNKGIHILIQVIEELNKAGYKDKLFFDLAGKGPLYDHYRNEHPLTNIKYWGFISDEDLKQLYTDSHVFVFPTLFEGMPTVVLEAMSQSLPIIVSDVGATSELVDDQNGYLLPKNDVKAVKEAILKYYHLNQEQKRAMGKASYKRVNEHFTWDAVAKRHLVCFDEVLSET